MNPAYAKFLKIKSQCPKGPKTSKNIMRDPLVHFDTSTPTRLDNYYQGRSHIVAWGARGPPKKFFFPIRLGRKNN